MCEPWQSRIVPMPFRDLPDSPEPLTALRYADVMHSALEQCCGLAEVCYVAATHPDGLPDGLPQALAILEQYTECALALYELWHETQHAGPRVQADATEGDDDHEA